MQQEEKKAEILEATVSPGFVALWMVDSGQWSPRAPTPGHQRPRPGADQINVGLQRGVEVYSTVQYSTVQCSEMSHRQPSTAQPGKQQVIHPQWSPILTYSQYSENAPTIN